jgi:hypothetical protein
MTTPTEYRAFLESFIAAEELILPSAPITEAEWEVQAVANLFARARALLAAPEAVDGICTGCDTPRHKAIAAVAKGAVACCPDCSTLTVADRNAIREAAAQRAAPEAVGVADEPTMQEEALVALERIRSGDVSNGDDDFLLVEQGLRERSRFAHPAQVPVGERLPGVGDCDAKGRCWCFSPVDGNGHQAGWTFRRLQANIYDTHWLPHWSLPLPGAQP